MSRRYTREMAQFLYHDAAERERLLDLSMRLLRPYAVTVAIMSVALLFGIGVFGWVCFVPTAMAVVLYVAATARIRRVAHPERLLIANAVAGVLASLACIWLAEGPKEYLFALPAFPLFTVAPIFARRVSIVGVLLTAIGLTAVAMVSYGSEVSATPPMLILPVMLMLVVVLGAMASRSAEDVNRTTAVVDPLTGLLNRVALQTRASELALHARATNTGAALLVVDIDHFKAVNDDHGHAAGDAVLIAVAARFAQAITGIGGMYRFGGEEFVALVPDATPGGAADLAERLRRLIEAESVEGLDLTVSVGVSVSSPGEAFDYREHFVRADRALYRAKSGGRNRVCVAVEETVEAFAESAAAPARRAIDRLPDVVGDAGALDLVQPAPSEDSGWDVRLRGREDGNWLVGDGVERGHVVDLLERSAKDSETNSLIVLGALIASGFWVHWWGLIPAIAAGVIWQGCTRALPTARRPEFAILAGLLAMTISSGLSMVLAQGPILYALPTTSIVTLGAAASFRARGATVIGVTAVLTTILTGLAIDASAVVATPFIVIFPVALVVSTVVLGEAMGRSAREHRVAAITDGLTGSLNRAALEARIPLLAQHTQQGVEIAVVVVDIDHFKRVNDRHGHEAGDAVLSEVAYRLRSSLRPFDSVYRVGGEEFVAVLVGTSAPDALAIAERMRQEVESNAASGVAVTISAGVATSPGGQPFDYDALFAVADGRLYAAKQAGRNRVVSADDAIPTAAVLAKAA